MKYSNKEDFEKANIFGMGNPNDAFAQYFIGNSYLNPLNEFGESPVFVANVTFEPGCRNNWHIHKASKGGGQILICTAGEVKHWHGAKADSWFSHIAVEVPGENTSNEWLEEVNDEHYKNLIY